MPGKSPPRCGLHDYQAQSRRCRCSNQYLLPKREFPACWRLPFRSLYPVCLQLGNNPSHLEYIRLGRLATWRRCGVEEEGHQIRSCVEAPQRSTLAGSVPSCTFSLLHQNDPSRPSHLHHKGEKETWRGPWRPNSQSAVSLPFTSMARRRSSSGCDFTSRCDQADLMQKSTQSLNSTNPAPAPQLRYPYRERKR